MPERKIKRGGEDKLSAPGAPAWMVTYGDLMTLLLTFFVIIVSFSTIELDKFRAAIGALRGALQPWAPALGGPNIIKQQTMKMSDSNFLETAAEEVMELFEEEGMTPNVEVMQMGGGIRIILSDPLLFDEGRDELKLAVKPIIMKLVDLAKRIDSREIVIEGHTDDTPINTEKFPSNWELSAARALRVLKVFSERNYPPDKLVAVGYGEHRPRKKLPANATREEKGVNRRVEIFLNVIGEKTGLFSRIPMFNDDSGWGD